MLNRASSFALWLLISLSGAESVPQLLVEAPIFGSKLQYEVGGTGVLLLGEELLGIPLQELSTRKCTCGVACHLLCELTEYTVLGLVSAVGICLDVPQASGPQSR